MVKSLLGVQLAETKALQLSISKGAQINITQVNEVLYLALSRALTILSGVTNEVSKAEALAKCVEDYVLLKTMAKAVKYAKFPEFANEVVQKSMLSTAETAINFTESFQQMTLEWQRDNKSLPKWHGRCVLEQQQIVIRKDEVQSQEGVCVKALSALPSVEAQANSAEDFTEDQINTALPQALENILDIPSNPQEYAEAITAFMVDYSKVLACLGSHEGQTMLTMALRHRAPLSQFKKSAQELMANCEEVLAASGAQKSPEIEAIKASMAELMAQLGERLEDTDGSQEAEFRDYMEQLGLGGGKENVLPPVEQAHQALQEALDYLQLIAANKEAIMQNPQGFIPVYMAEFCKLRDKAIALCSAETLQMAREMLQETEAQMNQLFEPLMPANAEMSEEDKQTKALQQKLADLTKYFKQNNTDPDSMILTWESAKQQYAKQFPLLAADHPLILAAHETFGRLATNWTLVISSHTLPDQENEIGRDATNTENPEEESSLHEGHETPPVGQDGYGSDPSGDGTS